MTVGVAAAGGVGSLSRSLVSTAARVNTAGASSDQSANYLRPRALLTTIQGAYVSANAGSQRLSQPTPTPEAEPTPEPQPLYYTYTVQEGDTLAGIAAAFAIHPNYIMWNNHDVRDDPDLLVLDQKLVIPSVDGVIYTVKLGDTLSDLAAFYEIDVQDIVNFAPNRLASADAVIDGTELVLPGAVPPPPPPPPPPEPPPASAPAPGPAPQPASGGGYVWPFVGPISTYFGEGGWHYAIDIDGFGRCGAPVVAAASGTVVVVSWQDYGLGYHVIVRHADGSETVYAHVSDIYVGLGQTVGQGETIGAIGSTGYSTGCHLHLALYIGGGPVDPLAYLP